MPKLTPAQDYAKRAIKDTWESSSMNGCEDGFDSVQAFVDYEMDGDAFDFASDNGIAPKDMEAALAEAYRKTRYTRFYRNG